MKLKDKLLFIFLILLIPTTLLIYTNYQTHKKHYNKIIEYSIDSAVDKIKFDIQKADSIVAKIAQFKHQIFENIHQVAHQKLKQNPNLNINQLKRDLVSTLPHKFVDIHIYLINKNYTIYKTTYQPDLHLNMKKLLGAKEYIDTSFANIDKIHFAIQPSFDILSKKYRLYSYSALNSNIILELGFFDKALSSIKDHLYRFNFKDSIIKDVDIFVDYENYMININESHKISDISKEKYLQKVASKRDPKVVQVIKTKSKIHYDIEEANKKYRICYRYVDRSKVSNNHFKEYVLKAKIDITSLEATLTELRYMLYATSLVTLFLILFLVTFFSHSILKPFKVIIETLKLNEDIQDHKLLAKRDEFGEISQNINLMNNRLNCNQQEIDQKTQELKIANDQLQSLNASLQDRIKQEVAKNRSKDQQLLAQSRLAQMGEMIAMIAHQWRQPLTAINSLALNLELKATMKNISQREVRKNSQEISKYALHLSETIDDFRNFFRPHKAQKETSFCEIIESVFKIIKDSLDIHDITILQELSCEENFVAYPNELKHVLLNLLKNTQDAFIENDILERNITIKTYLKGHKKVLELHDNAGGIPQEIIGKIFDPYFSTKSNQSGTGLGLYMSKMIVEKHSGGALEVESSGSATIFRILL